MGHNIQFKTFDFNTPAKDINDYCRAYADNYCDSDIGCGSGFSGISFESYHVYDTYEEAEAYLERASERYSYDERAVPYLEYPEITKTKKILSLEEKLKDKYQKWYKLSNTNHFKEVKSAFVGCPFCKSRINSKYAYNYCRVCGKDMRPVTTLNMINKLNEDVVALRAAIKAEEAAINEKNKSKAVKKWLVRFEFHS